MDESMDLAVQLDKHRNAIEQKERQGDQILKVCNIIAGTVLIVWKKGVRDAKRRNNELYGY